MITTTTNVKCYVSTDNANSWEETMIKATIDGAYHVSTDNGNSWQIIIKSFGQTQVINGKYYHLIDENIDKIYYEAMLLRS